VVLRLSWQGRYSAPGRLQALGAAELSALRRSAVRQELPGVHQPRPADVRRDGLPDRPLVLRLREELP